MASHLEPCPFCNRHVRIADPACPFCDATLPAEFRARPARAHPVQRLGRAALFAFSASVAGTTACGGDDGDETGKTMPEATGGGGGASGSGTIPGAGGASAGTGGSVQALYGAVPAPLPDAGADGGDTTVDPRPIPSVQPLYGAAPAD